MTHPSWHRFAVRDMLLQSGVHAPQLQLAYQTYGTLNADRSNAILFMTPFGAQHTDIEWMVGEGRALDPSRYFIVIPNQLGNGLSSSPSTAEAEGIDWTPVQIADNVAIQHKLLTERYGVERLALAAGWSMGGMQAYQWAAHHPEAVARLAVICGSARTAPHTHVFLEGVRAVLTLDPAYRDGQFAAFPERSLRALGRVWAGWALSQAFYRDELWRKTGCESLEAYLTTHWEANYLRRDPANLLAHMGTWQQHDISAGARFGGDIRQALGAITAPALIMPGRTDLYFPVEDSAREVEALARGVLKVIPSDWGHRAGMNAYDPVDATFVDDALRTLLLEPSS